MARTKSPAFFSYARADSDFALRVANDLRKAGANIWVDQFDIRPGDKWDQAIERALNDSVQLIVLLSPAANHSDNVMDEVAAALEQRKMVIPALIADCPMPFRLRRLQHVDFRVAYDDAMAKLLDVLRGDNLAGMQQERTAPLLWGAEPSTDEQLISGPQVERDPENRALAHIVDAIELNTSSSEVTAAPDTQRKTTEDAAPLQEPGTSVEAERTVINIINDDRLRYIGMALVGFLVLALSTFWYIHYRSNLKPRVAVPPTSATTPGMPVSSIRLDRIWQFRSHTAPVSGFRLLKSNLVASWSEDKTLRMWSNSDGSLRLSLPHEEPVGAVQFSPDEKLVITRNKGHRVSYLWDLTARIPEQPVFRVPRANGIEPLSGWTSIAWVPQAGPIRLWHPDRHETELERSQDYSPGDLFDAEVDSHMYVASWGSPGSVWDAKTGKLIQRVSNTENYDFNFEVGRFEPIVPVTESSDNAYSPRSRSREEIMVQNRGGNVLVSAKQPNGLTVTLDIPGQEFAWAPGGRTLAVVDRRAVHLWSAESRTIARDLTLPKMPDDVTLLSSAKPLWSPSARFVLAHVDDRLNSLAVWDGSTGDFRVFLRGHQQRVTGVLWDRAEQYLFTIADMMHRMWDIESGTLVQKFTCLTPVMASDDTILGITTDDYETHSLSLWRTKRKNPVIPAPQPKKTGISRKNRS